MTKRGKVLPARKPRDRSRDDDSLLLRSAESLGRVIGALQRQLDGATKRLTKPDGQARGRKVRQATASTARATAGNHRRLRKPAATKAAKKR